MGDAHHMELHAQLIAIHALRVADAAAAIEVVGGRDGVDDFAVLDGIAGARRIERGLNIGRADLPARDVEGDVGIGRLRRAAGDADKELMHATVGHDFGAVHGGADRGDRRIHVDDGAGLQPLGGVLADADNAQVSLAVPLGDEAGDLGGA